MNVAGVLALVLLPWGGDTLRGRFLLPWSWGTQLGRFDRRAWRRDRGVFAGNRRAGQLWLLERDVLRKGLERRRVRWLLGAPDWTHADADAYELGDGRDPLAGSTYVVCYDAEGRVAWHGVPRGS